jgi:peptidoglycan/LPS O-acetylase OafA/YrhL
MWLPGVFCFLGCLRMLKARLLLVMLMVFLCFQGWVDSSPMVEQTGGWGGFARAVSGLGSGFLLASVFLRFGGRWLPEASWKRFWGGSLFFALAFASILLAPDFRVAGFLFPIFAAASIFLLASAEVSGGCVFPPMAQDVIEFFATRSYAIYLIHMPLIALSSHLLGAGLSGNAPLKLVLIGATIVASDAVYRWIEVPGYRLRKSFKVLA